MPKDKRTTPEEREQIFEMYKQGARVPEIASEFGVCTATVMRIIKRLNRCAKCEGKPTERDKGSFSRCFTTGLLVCSDCLLDGDLLSPRSLARMREHVLQHSLCGVDFV